MQVPAGTATNFTRVPARRRGRLMLQAANLTVLPPEAAAFPAAGSTFMPVCPAAAPCSTAGVVAQFVPEGQAGVVHSECFPVQRITVTGTSVVQGLANDTAYSVLLVTSDLAGHHAAWAAVVHTQDLTPPQLSVQQTPPPSFTSFGLVAGLNEPGTVYALLAPASAAAPATAACPPPSMVRECCWGAGTSLTCGAKHYSSSQLALQQLARMHMGLARSPSAPCTTPAAPRRSPPTATPGRPAGCSNTAH